jgi:lipopolysaccharide heptosyltransferase II
MSRLLVVLPNWFGETLFTTPFFRALRERQPHAFIAALGWPPCHEVLRHNPRIDELVVYDEQRAHRGLGGMWRLITTLRRYRFDTAVILRRSLSRTALLCVAGIPRRVGFANAKSGWLLTDAVPMPPSPRHKALSYLSLLAAFPSSAEPPHVNGASEETIRCEYAVTNAERQEARQSLEAQGIASPRPVVILHPGANWPHKRWAPASFAAVGDQLAQTHAAHIVITGGPDDVALADSIRQQMRHPAVVLAGRTTFRQLAACLSYAQLVISNDTGVLHLAAALDRPVVALYGPTSPRLTGPLGDRQKITVLHHADCCPRMPCLKPEQPPHLGMGSITVDEVVAASSHLLGAAS